MDSETRTELDAYIEDWQGRTLAQYQDEVADGLLSEADTEQVEEVISEFFTFQAAACTTQPDCQCGRDHSEWAEAMRASDAGAWDEA